MSFPSVQVVAAERGYSNGNIPPHEAPDILLEAVRRDCPEAVEFLHSKAHEAEKTGRVQWDVPLDSPLMKQLIRIHAVSVVREMVQARVCHGQKLEFYNCHIGTIGGDELTLEQRALYQIHCQDGTIASPDC